MSLLTPLYILGLAAISLPILFHLMRRTPQGVQPFSSLMFIVATPPRLTRRSRIDQLLLLLLRAAIVGLLALAFARPFFRQAATADLPDLSGRLVAVLIDTSASMRRSGIWEQVAGELERVLKDLGPQDSIALYQFANRVERIVSLDESRSLTLEGRRELVRNRFRQLQPLWSDSQLGAALIRVADDVDAAEDQTETASPKQLVVISDLQEGSQLESLQGYQWPASVHMVARPVDAQGTSNASLQLLDASDEADHEQGVRVRVQNAADSRAQQLAVCWGNGDGEPLGRQIAVAVPPGESRVVRVPPPAAETVPTQLLLTGDDHDFDNHYYVAAAARTAGTILYCGGEAADDPEHMLYYLTRALTNDRSQQVEIVTARSPAMSELEATKPLLVVVTGPLEPAAQDSLRRYLLAGGTGLMVLSSAADSATLAALTGTNLGETEDRLPSDYVLWSNIDFGHPLFRAFANPLYSDFSMIHFWSYRRVVLPAQDTWKTLVQYDNGDVAFASCTIDKGTLYLLTSTWAPGESDLARSSKFVPLLSGIVRRDAPSHGASHEVDEPIMRPLAAADSEVTVERPDGSLAPFPDGEPRYAGTDQPGLYRLRYGQDERVYAVNLATSETRTAPLDVAQLEQRGVQLGAGESRAKELEALRQLRDMELEARQNAWQWMIAAALLLLILETILAGRWAVRQPPADEREGAGRRLSLESHNE